MDAFARIDALTILVVIVLALAVGIFVLIVESFFSNEASYRAWRDEQRRRVKK